MVVEVTVAGWLVGQPTYQVVAATNVTVPVTVTVTEPGTLFELIFGTRMIVTYYMLKTVCSFLFNFLIVISNILFAFFFSLFFVAIIMRL